MHAHNLALGRNVTCLDNECMDTFIMSERCLDLLEPNRG